MAEDSAAEVSRSGVSRTSDRPSSSAADNDDVIPSFLDEDLAAVYLSSRYQDMKKEFEKRVCVVRRPRNPDIKFAIKGDSDHQHAWRHLAGLRLDFSTWIISVENPNSDKAPQLVPFVNLWVKDREQRSYRYADVLPPPLVVPANVLNVYCGMAAERLPVTTQRCPDHILRHLWLLVGGGHDVPVDMNDKRMVYALSWLAQLFQSPGQLTGTALVFRSLSKGCGKTTFTQFVGKMLGADYYRAYQSVKRIVAQFSDAMLDRLLVILNDPRPKEFKSNLNALMYRIDNDVIDVEIKQGATLQVRNVCRFIVNTNEEVLPAHTDDRRLVMFECNEWLGDKRSDHYSGYHETLYEGYKLESTQRAFYDFLMAYKIPEGFDWIRDRPVSRMFRESVQSPKPRKKLSLEVELFEDWCVELLAKGQYVNLARAMLKDFMMWCIENSRTLPVGFSVEKMGKNFSDLPGWDQKHTNKGTRWTMLPDDLRIYLKARLKL